jgi:hypothetical protein
LLFLCLSLLFTNGWVAMSNLTNSCCLSGLFPIQFSGLVSKTVLPELHSSCWVNSAQWWVNTFSVKWIPLVSLPQKMTVISSVIASQPASHSVAVMLWPVFPLSYVHVQPQSSWSSPVQKNCKPNQRCTRFNFTKMYTIFPLQWIYGYFAVGWRVRRSSLVLFHRHAWAVVE